jgi:uncharacterized protein with GYD domain
MLNRYTAQGITNVKESPARLDALKEVFKRNGGEIKQVFFVMGAYDTVLGVDAPDDETCARLSLTIGTAGNVHVETLRAFSEDEFRRIVAGVP